MPRSESVLRALIIPPDGNGEVRDIEPDLDSMKEAIGGGWLEAVSGGDWVAYLDEEGKLKRLPVNVPASALARALGWPVGDVMCGTVMFVGPADSHGYDQSVSGEVVEMARRAGIV
jgi:hypothetical protein